MIAEAFLTSEDAKAKYRLGSFTFNGLDSGDYGIFLTSPPKFALAERDVTTESVPGRNGDLVNDNGRYKNVLVTYKCAICW